MLQYIMLFLNDCPRKQAFDCQQYTNTYVRTMLIKYLDYSHVCDQVNQLTTRTEYYACLTYKYSRYSLLVIVYKIPLFF